MTDVSTYIEAEEYVTNFYEKYSVFNISSKIENHTTIYIDNPRVFTPNNCTSTSCKNTTESVELAKS
jgi:hypothetical protein